MTTQGDYDHVQRGRIHWLIYAVATICTWAGIAVLDGTVEPEADFREPGLWLFFSVAAVSVLLAMNFQYMRVRDGGDVLQINFGPLPLLSREVSYGDIESVTQGRTSVIDGWGVHVMPGRGWTWNIWGRDCAELRVDGAKLRVGTNDPAGLVALIQKRMAESVKA
ncbi:MAG: hypothetical protein ACI9EF_000109 [Pseudohongiellaceae bacterium]|jgi:hypothetical protein